MLEPTDKHIHNINHADKHSSNSSNNQRRATTVNGDVGHDEPDQDGDEDEDEVDDPSSSANRVNALLLHRDKKHAQNRIYKKARYAQLREAEEMLKATSSVPSEDIDIQQLQLLANKRQQILEYARAYRQTHPQHNHRWVPITQVWDEDSPCR